MKSIIIFTLVVFFIVTSSFQAVGEEWTAEQKEIWTMVENGWEYAKNKDFESDMAGKHDNALSLHSDKPTPLSNDQVKSFHEGWMASDYKLTSYKLKPITINIIENVAYVFNLFSWHSEINDFTGKGRTMSTYVKLNNKWVFVGSMSASCDKSAPCPYGWEFENLLKVSESTKGRAIHNLLINRIYTYH